MGNERRGRPRDEGGRWGRDEDDDYGRREAGRGEYSRFAQDEDGGGRGRSVWGEQDRGRWRDDDDVRGMRGREELPSVGSPGVGGGTGGWWDQGYEDRGRGGDELRYGRGGGTYGRELDESRRFGGGRGLEDESWERASYGRGREEGARTYGGRGMATSAGWGRTMGAGYGEGDEDWSPTQTGLERTARGWGGGVGRQPSYEAGRERTPPGRGRPLTSTGQRGFAGKGPMNYQRPDPRIHEDVCDRLTEDDEIDASQIEVRVERAEVTLTGTVASREMKRRAEELAEDIPGVRDVHNQLKVRDRADREGRDAREGRNGERAGGNGDRRNRA